MNQLSRTSSCSPPFAHPVAVPFCQRDFLQQRTVCRLGCRFACVHCRRARLHGRRRSMWRSRRGELADTSSKGIGAAGGSHPPSMRAGCTIGFARGRPSVTSSHAQALSRVRDSRSYRPGMAGRPCDIQRHSLITPRRAQPALWLHQMLALTHAAQVAEIPCAQDTGHGGRSIRAAAEATRRLPWRGGAAQSPIRVAS